MYMFYIFKKKNQKGLKKETLKQNISRNKPNIVLNS